MFKILKSFGSVQSPYRKVDDVEYDNYGNRLKKKEVNAMYDDEYWGRSKRKKKDKDRLLNATLEKR